MENFFINTKLQPIITLVKEVGKQIQSLKDFFSNNDIKDLEELIKKRERLNVVLLNLNNNIDSLIDNQSQDQMNTKRKESMSVKCVYYNKYEDIKGDINEGEIEVYENVLSKVETIRDTQINLYDELLINQSKFVAPYKETIDVYIKNIKTNIERLNTEYNNINYTNKDNDEKFSSNMKIFSGYNRDSLIRKILTQKRTLNEFLIKLNVFLSLTNPYKEETFSLDAINAFRRPHAVFPYVSPFYRGGTYNKTNKKSILGKERCIYKKSGDRKEYIKYKGNLIAVREYKKLMKILKKK
jgi:hypothetical protein